MKSFFTSMMLGLCMLACQTGFCQNYPSFDSAAIHSPWINRAYRKLSLKKKVAQLFIIAAYSNRSGTFTDSIGHLIQKFQPGGIIFFQGGPVRQARISNTYQQSLRLPALEFMDAEWGLGMRLDSTVNFPYQMSLGAIADNRMIRSMAGQIALDFRRMGMQVNFAPDMDVNNNSKNTVINFRSFGENKENVSLKGIAFIEGLQAEKVLATAKHFPGHGDTDVDSHMDLPVLHFDQHRLDSLELYPFREAISNHLAGIMVAHMSIPALDTSLHLPSSLSPRIIDGLLKTRMHYQGMVFTDALNMKGVSKWFDPGQTAVLAIRAGNDMVEMSPDLRASVKAVKKAVRRGLISREELEFKCRKVLALKEWAGLTHYTRIDTLNLTADLNRKEESDLVQQLSDSSVTLLRMNRLKKQSAPLPAATALICLGVDRITLLGDSLARQYMVPVFTLRKDASQASVDSLKILISGYEHLIVTIHDQRLRPAARLNFSGPLIGFTSALAIQKNSTLIFFTNAYALAQFDHLDKSSALLVTYQDSRFTEYSVLKFIKGSLKCRGHLPVSIAPLFHSGEGI